MYKGGVFIQSIYFSDDIIYNCYGDNITDRVIVLSNELFGYVDENNIPHINWGSENDICDAEGYDKRFRPNDGSSVYVIEDFVLPQGTLLCRYGTPNGRFSTLAGTPYEYLGLPYKKETIQYNEYIVSKDMKIVCLVTKGKVAPKFDSPGGAIQFKHKQSIRLECEEGYLQEDRRWIQRRS